MRLTTPGPLAPLHISALLFLLLWSAGPTHAQQADSALIERGRALTEAFYAEDFAPIVSAFTEQARDAIGGREGLAGFRGQLLSQLGAESTVIGEEVTDQSGYRVYARRARFAAVPDVVVVQWAFDSESRVAGFSIRPEQAPLEPAPTPHLDYRTRTPLRLPFDGEWTVFWGGRTVEENYHAAYRDQRFAYDIVVSEDGSRHTGDGSSNADYHCFGRPILAPGPGTVAHVRDGIPDNIPGEMNPEVPPGNHVVLDHGNGEFSFLAHLQMGTVRVERGTRVAGGDTLGLCGNSGNSSEPHLHYHLQDTPDFGQGQGLPAQFLGYVADGDDVARGEPVQGQRIRPGGEGH